VADVFHCSKSFIAYLLLFNIVFLVNVKLVLSVILLRFMTPCKLLKDITDMSLTWKIILFQLLWPLCINTYLLDYCGF